MEKRTHLDFLTSLVLAAVSAYILFESRRMAAEIGGPFYASPGMMTTVLGLLLLVTAILLFKRSVGENTLAGNIRDLKEWFRSTCEAKAVREMMLGILILAVYTFILAPKLPFVISTLIFLVFLMGVLNAATPVKIAAISLTVVGSIYVLFQIVFRVPLP